MKSFHQFYEQAVAAAPAPAPAAPKVAKAQPKAKAKPKVTDPSTGVDIDDKGRWQGDIVDQGKELEPEQKIKIKDGRKGPDPNLPTGEANPNKKKDDDLIAAHDKPFSKYPPAGGDDKWPGLPKDSIKDYLHPSKDPMLNIPITPFGLPPNWKAKNGKGTQIAQANNKKMPDYVRDSIRRQYKGGPDYKREDMLNIINWNKKKQA